MGNISKSLLHTIIGAALGLIIAFFVPAANGLTEIGVSILGCFAAILYWWLTVGTDWPSFIVMPLITMTGLFTASKVFTDLLGNATIVQLICMTALSKVLSDTGAFDTIVRWSMTREVVRNRPYVFLGIVFFVALVLSCIMSVGSVCLVFIALNRVFCEEIGYKKGDPFYSCLMIGVFWMSNLGNAGTPFGHATPLIMMNAAAAQGQEISIAQWLAVGIPFCILGFIACMAVVCFIWRPESSKFRNYDLDAARKQIPPMTKGGLITLILFGLIILWWVVPDIAKGLFPEGFHTARTAWGTTWPAVIAVCLLCVIHVDGKPVTTMTKACSTISIPVTCFVGAVMVLGNAVSAPDTGISAALAAICEPFTRGLSPFVIVALASFGAIVMTNFISNTVCQILWYTITIPILASMGISDSGLDTVTVIICLMANFASLVPSASPTAPYFFGNQDITVGNVLKGNVGAIIGVFLVTVFLVYPFGSMILG